MLAHPFGHGAHAFQQRYLGALAEHLFRLRVIRECNLDFVASVKIVDLAGLAYCLYNDFRKFVDGVRHVGTNIEYLVARSRVINRCCDDRCDIINMRECTLLRPVPKNWD